MSFFTITHCLQTWSEVWFTFLPLVSRICQVSGLIDLLSVFPVLVFLSFKFCVILVLWDVQWISWDHSTPEASSPVSVCFHLPLLRRKRASSVPPHIVHLCLEKEINITLQKYYWEQTQNGKSTSSVALLIFFKNIYTFFTEPCVISHLLITDFLCGWDADFGYISVNVERLYWWA